MHDLLDSPVVQIRRWNRLARILINDVNGKTYPTTLTPKLVAPSLREQLLGHGVKTSLLDVVVVNHLTEHEHFSELLACNILGAATVMQPKLFTSSTQVFNIDPPVVGMLGELITCPERKIALIASLDKKQQALGVELCAGSDNVSNVYEINRRYLSSPNL